MNGLYQSKKPNSPVYGKRLMFCFRKPGQESLSKCSSSVRRSASKIMEDAAMMQSGSFKDVARRISMAFCSTSSLSGITVRPSRNSKMSCSSYGRISRFDSSSIRTITLVKRFASSALIPSEDKSHCRSSRFITALVSKTILVPFIADSPLIRYTIAAKNTFVLPKKP